jgi:hypothetical protein
MRDWPLVTPDATAMYSAGSGLSRMKWKSTPSVPCFARNGVWTASFGTSLHRPQPISVPRVWTTITAQESEIELSLCM